VRQHDFPELVFLIKKPNGQSLSAKKEHNNVQTLSSAEQFGDQEADCEANEMRDKYDKYRLFDRPADLV